MVTNLFLKSITIITTTTTTIRSKDPIIGLWLGQIQDKEDNYFN
jgi:hypothetical protein